MSIIKELTNDIKSHLKSAGYEVEDILFVPSNRSDLGDYQLNDAMKLAKIYHESPRDIATKIVKELEADKRFTNINIAGPGFINITLTDEFLRDSLNKIYLNTNENIDKLPPKKIVLDYGGANVAKALHVGHLRSADIGEALKRLARVLGYEVISDAHLGDYGRPLGLVILEIKKRYPELAYFNENYQGDYSEIDLPITNKDLEEIYPIASSKAKEDENYLEEARIITMKLQNHEKGYYDIWQKIIGISKEEIKKIYDEINVSFDLWEGESDAAEYIEELLEILEKKGIVEESNGAKIINVETEEDAKPMPPLLLVKSNNTVSYETTDLATILERQKKFAPDEIWYCVDGRQELHFDQVFRATRMAKLVPDDTKLEFIGFGTMNGTDGKPFKTRDGGVMTLKGLIELVTNEILDRINKDMVEEKDRLKTAKEIAIATLKYTDLLPFRTTDYIFEVDKFSDFEGKTGPYLLYSTIRMNSLLQKAKEVSYNKIILLETKTEKELAHILLRLPLVLQKSLEMKSLNEISEYIYKLTALYNKFYSENKILIEENESLKESRLVLTKLVYDTNILLLDILGITVPKKM